MELLSSRLTLITRFCWLWGLIVFWRKAFCVNEKMLHRVTSLSCLSRCVQCWVQPPGRQSYHTYIVFPWVRSARRSAFNINCMVCQLRNVIIWSQGVRPSILITHTHARAQPRKHVFTHTRCLTCRPHVHTMLCTAWLAHWCPRALAYPVERNVKYKREHGNRLNRTSVELGNDVSS